LVASRTDDGVGREKAAAEVDDEEEAVGVVHGEGVGVVDGAATGCPLRRRLSSAKLREAVR
jgi:hypothetical protein